MEKKELANILEKQRKYFALGRTLNIQTRLSALANLKNAILRHEKDIYDALLHDLGKSNEESYMCEIGMVYSEITYMLKNTAKFSREKTVSTPLSQAVSRSFLKPSPKGCVLIMSPWNYPFMLSMEPLADALAAGNTAVIKPSAYAPYTAEVVKMIIKQAFNEEYVAVVTGGREENQALLEEKFDHIFFTGSQAVGREVLKKASQNLTPVTLELGGKSPCIVDKTAKLSLSARRIVFGKFLNCGQTCVAPDYILCEEGVRDELIKELKKEIKRQYGVVPLKNEKYGHIVNSKHFMRLSKLLEESDVVFGGKVSEKDLRIEPSILISSWEDKVMEDEIFGPILPVITYKSLDEEIERINSRPHPLALYIFSKDKENIEKAKTRVIFGGGCINDTIIHLATSNMGFGGTGESGMGAYHGKAGFDTFSHTKSIVDKKTFLDLPMRYQPYNKLNGRLIKFFLK